MISAVASRPKLSCIRTIGNEFNRQSIEAIKPLLQFDSFVKLEELSISHCSADQRSVFELLKCLLPQKAIVSEKELDETSSDHYTEEEDVLKMRSKLEMKKTFQTI